MWPRSQLVQVVQWIILLYATIASGCVLFASSVGLTGVLLNSRPILTFYNILLWPSLFSTAIVGYSSYKARVFNLSGKVNQMWTQSWSDREKTLIQDVVRGLSHGSFTHRNSRAFVAPVLRTLQPAASGSSDIKLSPTFYGTRMQDRIRTL